MRTVILVATILLVSKISLATTFYNGTQENDINTKVSVIVDGDTATITTICETITIADGWNIDSKEMNGSVFSGEIFLERQPQSAKVFAKLRDSKLLLSVINQHIKTDYELDLGSSQTTKVSCK